MDLEKVSELIDALVGERHDAVVVEAVDPDDAVLAVHTERDFVQQIFLDAELAGDSGDDGNGVDFVALHCRIATRGCCDQAARR